MSDFNEEALPERDPAFDLAADHLEEREGPMNLWERMVARRLCRMVKDGMSGVQALENYYR